MLRPSKRSSSDDWGGFCIKSILFIVEFYKYKKPLKNGKISKKSYKYNSPWPLRVKIRDKFEKWIIIKFHQFHVSFLVEDELLVCECRNICLSAVSCELWWAIVISSEYKYPTMSCLARWELPIKGRPVNISDVAPSPGTCYSDHLARASNHMFNEIYKWLRW